MKYVKKREEHSLANIIALRTGKLWAQARLAEELGVATNTINRLENGKTMLSAELAIKYAEYFHVSMDYLFGFSPYEEGEPECSATCNSLINAQNQIDLLDAEVGPVKIYAQNCLQAPAE